MAMIFNNKVFNEEVFGRYLAQIPNLKKYEINRSGAVVQRQDLAGRFSEQTGGHYITVPIKPRSTASFNLYDGKTDIELDKIGSYLQSRVVYGYDNGWTEDDFTYDIAGRTDFLEIAASLVSEWETDVDEQFLYAMLEGIFNSQTDEGQKFEEMKTTKVTGWDDVTMIDAIQKAMGDQKARFSMAMMHSSVATDLEKLNLLEYVKQVDANGLQRDTQIATINGRLVIVDDNMPFDETTEEYTSYIFGAGALEMTDVGAKNPYGSDRDELKRGGLDFFVARRRKVIAPMGFSWTTNQFLAPSLEQFKSGDYWDITRGYEGDGSDAYYPIKGIPIGRIISKAKTEYVEPDRLWKRPTTGKGGATEGKPAEPGNGTNDPVYPNGGTRSGDSSANRGDSTGSGRGNGSEDE